MRRLVFGYGGERQRVENKFKQVGGKYTDRSGKSGHISPAIVEKYLAGIHYPAEKKNLVEKARDNDARSDVVNLLNKLPNKTYKSPIDITKEIGKME